MNKSLQLIVMRMSVVLICCLFIGIESAGQNVQWALKGTKCTYPFHEGLAEFLDLDSRRHGFINTSGEIVIPAKFKMIRDVFHSGMAVVEVEDDEYGIIDRNGRFVLLPIYNNIHPCDEVPGMYELYTDDQKVGLFYNGRIVLPAEYDYISTYRFPIIEYKDFSGIRRNINLVTGDVIEGYLYVSSFVAGEKNGKNIFFDKNTGERLDSTSLTVSSQGVKLFQDEVTKLYGFRNQKTGAVIIKPKYKRVPWGVWEYDAMTVIDSVSRDMPKKSKIVDCYGKEWDLCKTGSEHISAIGNYYEISNYKDSKFYYGLYSRRGEELLPMAEQQIFPLGDMDGWFILDRSNLYDAKNNVLYPGVGFVREREGMIAVQRGKDSYYYVDAVTRKKLDGEYTSVREFHEGLALVQFSDDIYDRGFIDKKGNVVLRGSKQLQFENYFSDGVVGASYNPDNYKEAFDGYIYNPLGHKGYSYNASDNMAVGHSVIMRWRDTADEAYENEQYGKAKDYYYKIMMNQPNDTKALLGYGNCMNNLGYYDEAIECYQLALDIDPTYELAQTNLDISLSNKQRREEREERERVGQENQSTQSSTFWDALGSFASMLGNFSGATNTYQPYSSFSSDYSSGSSNYQSQYNMWAKRAESNYNSLTNLGYSAKSKSGNRSGGTLQSMNGGNYILMKKNLRDAQHEMQRIRREAARNGVTIQQSPWETATVKY